VAARIGVAAERRGAEAMRTYRVVQWSTGGVGALALAALTRRSDLELVGTWVHAPEKVGRDAGDLVGVGPVGVRATDDPEAVLALAPDCVCYTASGEARPKEAVDDCCRLLDAGINVVTTSVPGLLYPAGYDAAEVARLEAACREGGASLYCSGIEPGFAGDQLVLVLATLTERIHSVRTQEIFGYADYPVAFTIFDVFGFGKPAEERCLMELPGVQASAWGSPVRMVVDGLGAPLDAIRETYEKRTTDRRLDVAAGTIEAGTVGAVRFETIGVVDGRDAVVIEHVNRMAPELAPDWPTAARDGTYRVTFDGAPSLTCELALGGPADFSHHGMVATAMRVVNAIPFVCDAQPGIVTSADLPLTLPYAALTT
jgi:2,4-diaminopentanoate dehydrogenase